MTGPVNLPAAEVVVPRSGARLVALAYGLVCHAVFVFGVGAMMVEMASGMHDAFGRVPGRWLVLTNGLLLLQFPLIHSLLLARPGRRLLGRLAPLGLGSALSTTTYAAVASVQVALLFLLWTPSGIVWWRAEGGALVAILALYLGAWLLLLKAIVDAGLPLQVGLLGWWAVFRARKPTYPGLPRRGLFRLCRQPIYVAFALTTWTVPVWTPDQLVVAAVLTFYCVVGPLFKEARFRRVFGADFVRYQARMPYWLPLPRKPAPPPSP